MNKTNIVPTMGNIILEKKSIIEDFKYESGLVMPSDYRLAKVLFVDSPDSKIKVNETVLVHYTVLKEVPVNGALEYMCRTIDCKYKIESTEVERDSTF